MLKEMDLVPYGTDWGWSSVGRMLAKHARSPGFRPQGHTIGVMTHSPNPGTWEVHAGGPEVL